MLKVKRSILFHNIFAGFYPLGCFRCPLILISPFVASVAQSSKYLRGLTRKNSLNGVLRGELCHLSCLTTFKLDHNPLRIRFCVCAIKFLPSLSAFLCIQFRDIPFFCILSNYMGFVS